MRIISKFTDYYDSIQSVGYDPTLVYDRTARIDNANAIIAGDQFILERQLKNMGIWFSNSNTLRTGLLYISEFSLQIGNNTQHVGQLDQGILFFCGKSYPFIKTTRGDYFFTVDSLYDYFAEHTWKENSYFKSTRWIMQTLVNCGDSLRQRNFKSLEVYFNSTCDLTDFSRYLNLPIFSFECNDIRKRIVNLLTEIQLRKMNFSKMVDPYTAYQEIAMYISNDLAKEESGNAITDNVVLRDSKGFDKHSFKKGPTK